MLQHLKHANILEYNQELSVITKTIKWTLNK